MKAVKLGSILFASMFVLNSFGQADGRTERRETPKHEINEKDNQTQEQRAKIQTDQLNEQLILTEDQKAKIHEINLGIIMKNDAVKEHPTWTKEQKHEAFEGNNTAKYQMIKSFLTKEQIAKFEEMEMKKKVH